MAEGGGLEFDITAPNIKAVLSGIRKIDPKLATALRRELRQTGEEIVAAQRARLGTRPPRIGVRKRLILVKDKGKKARMELGFATYEPLRSRIAAGLRTRVSTGKLADKIDVKTSGPRKGGANMARVYQARVFRHPVFGGGWAEQAGQPYFFEPVEDEMRSRMSNRIHNAMQEAILRATI